MIPIAAIFGLVVYFEWLYLQRNNRKRRTKWLVIAVACFLTLCIEVIYLFDEKLSLGILIDSIFSPIQKLLFA
ncbi:hypothetical protein Back11_41090 [Paenibacillus baekrokdamisoli]|uniref:Uncharacterized protein n=1 Tax=Paenibacillus baekrokdamisoli TaxID=1712516 RepID=A0A3G9JIF3_9BACL|nr:hypothetical protein [Paenibacillus baekrokdamisoli]MBB3068192.1 hypothetical protein [Paenibacillus baekrokdamisoli]BBH22764.1 hypothetical protein Back11_41090 [Paenibacillus baekrokdamisoli]